MKYDQKLEQLQKQGEIRKHMEMLQNYLNKILSGESQKVSYQMAYDTVYKLTKQRHQKEVVELVEEQVTNRLRGELEGVEEVGQAARVIKNMGSMITRVTEICLFLDVNYFQKELGSPLMKKLQKVVFQTLCSSSTVLDTIARGLFEHRQAKGCTEFEILTLVKAIDEKEEFFEKHFLSHYTPILREHHLKQADKKWEELGVDKYLLWAKQQLEQEKKWTEFYLVGKRGREGLEAVMGCVYEALVVSVKQRLYQTQDTYLFEELTVPVMELLRFGRQKEMEGHVQWYMGGIEKRLKLISTDKNEEFLFGFCDLFDHVATLLKNTQNKFQLHYRSVFAFEQWINNQRFNLPLRLNLLIDHRLRGQGDNSTHPPLSEFVGKIILLFKLIKQKTLFENVYRRMLLKRLIDCYDSYGVEAELVVVRAMEEECGEDWAKKIKGIISLFVKNRELVLKGRTGGLWTMGELLPVVVEEDDWPFEQRQSKIELHPDIMALAPKFEKAYMPPSSNHKLFWSPFVGSLLLSIRFEGASRQFVVSVEAANLLLWVQRGKTKLGSYLCQSGYKPDEVEASVQKLIGVGLLHSVGDGSDMILSLAAKFEEGPLIDLSREQTRIQVQAMQQLRADRKLMVQAIVVKIMKSEKMARRQDLVQKTAPLLLQRGFNFNIEFVQKSIDRLLDKQFLRDFEDGNIGYIA